MPTKFVHLIKKIYSTSKGLMKIPTPAHFLYEMHHIACSVISCLNLEMTIKSCLAIDA